MLRVFRLTAMDVAKPQFRLAFGSSIEQDRCASAASVRTIKPSTASAQSASSLASVLFYRRPKICTPNIKIRPNLTDLELETLPRCVLNQLRALSTKVCMNPEIMDVPALDDILHETASMGENLLTHMQASVDDATMGLKTTPGPGGEAVVSAFLCLLWMTPHARSMMALIGELWQSCNSTSCRMSLSCTSSPRGYVESIVTNSKRATHLQIPRRRKESDLHILKGIQVRFQLLIPENASLRGLQVLQHHSSKGIRDHVRTE